MVRISTNECWGQNLSVKAGPLDAVVIQQLVPCEISASSAPVMWSVLGSNERIRMASDTDRS